ncbi:Pre-mRNA-splicing factor of RES complex-domain-containing protein [Blakeslea trispora]|nr:Pre-mRNA-splicing factor of RES complex-domain-containing protein [Blakeslea trispora]
MSYIEDDKAQQVIAGDNAFRGSTSNWETVRPMKEEYISDEDERPLVVKTEGEDFSDNTPRMSNGQRAGILTKEQIKAEAERASQAEKKAMAKLKQEYQGVEGEDTVYRDASGRKVDPKRQRAEEMRLRQEQIDREARKMEWGKGLVQRKEAEEKRRQLEEAKDMPMARYADDEQLNQELKDRERWNDPAAGFLTKKSSSKSKGSRLVKPTYKGAWKPNRFMIAPGYRWDGVDRSTGYEDQLLLQINQAKSQAARAHEWSTEDM